MPVLFAVFFPVLLLLAATPADSQQAGFEALDRGDYRQAEEIFSKAAAADPKDYTALFNLALAETSLKKDEVAVSHYHQVLTLKPGLYEAELNLGMLYLRDHRPGDALPLLREAVHRLNAEKPADFYWRAVVFDKLHQFKPALENYQQFLQLSQGKFPDQEFLARQRSRILEKEARR